MIIFTGDTHGDFSRFFNHAFDDLTKDDYVIICGDFGGIWSGSPQEDKMLDKLEKLPFTLLFVDGNHECFDRLYKYPVVEWHGGCVHEIRPHVLHLIRGEIFHIDGYKIFAMGGAKSHDIQDGILNPADPLYRTKKRRLDKAGGMYRILGKSWWLQEVPSSFEINCAAYNLSRFDWNVDFIVTNEAPTSIDAQFGYDNLEVYDLMETLEEIKNKCQYKKWFFGHHHWDANIDKKHTLLYHSCVEIRRIDND